MIYSKYTFGILPITFGAEAAAKRVI